MSSVADFPMVVPAGEPIDVPPKENAYTTCRNKDARRCDGSGKPIGAAFQDWG